MDKVNEIIKEATVEIAEKKGREFSYKDSEEIMRLAVSKALSLAGVSQQRELLDWLSNEPDHNIRKSDIEEILQDFKYYQSNCG